MAARQDQGLVITLITFVILFIIAFVAAYVGWKSYSDSQTALAALTQQKNNADQAVRDADAKMVEFRKMIGVGENESADDLAKTFKDDMARFAASFDPNQQSYRNVLEYLGKEKDDLAVREAEAKKDSKETKDRLLAVETEKEKQVLQYASQMKAAEEDVTSQRATFSKDRESLEAKKQELLDNLAQQETRYEGQISEVNTKLQDLTERFTKSERAKENLLAEVSKSAESFEVPDGRVSWVNQDGTVWINLGAADSVRRQISFAVFDADMQDPAKTDQKGSIEVTRILGDHMAEAQITSDDPGNPILTGDKIYSQVWHRGKKLRFALTGIIDLDGDGRSDMQMARDLIELNGGAVDAFLADDGTVEGEITVSTRYLVIGTFPEGANQAALQAGWKQMSDDAQVNGVEVITLDKFLNQIGYAPGDRTVQLGAKARRSDFPPQQETGSVDGAGRNTPFPPRTPNRADGKAPSSSGRYFRFGS